jgi:benzil reductase ((S)-benzoin forming)
VDTPMQAQVRRASEADFPDVERFKAMKADGVLRAPEDVAKAILALEARGKFTHGGIHDIRQMEAA